MTVDFCPAILELSSLFCLGVTTRGGVSKPAGMPWIFAIHINFAPRHVLITPRQVLSSVYLVAFTSHPSHPQLLTPPAPSSLVCPQTTLPTDPNAPHTSFHPRLRLARAYRFGRRPSEINNKEESGECAMPWCSNAPIALAWPRHYYKSVFASPCESLQL